MVELNRFDEDHLVERLEQGIAPLSNAIVALLDGQEVPGEALHQAYLDWAGPASILSYQLRRQGRESYALKQMSEHGPELDQKIEHYLAYPTPESLTDMAETWMAARAGSQQLITQLETE